MTNRLRNEGACTLCSKPLPASKLGWGLVWDDKKTGVCAKCLYDIRVASGVFEGEEKVFAPKRRPKQEAPTPE
jgi:hypothetical protein